MAKETYLHHNREVWNQQALGGENEWCQPVATTTIQDARQGNWNVILTPLIDVPRDWFGEITGKNVLCLASGGGQQAPTIAAAGAIVTSFDLSEEQLALDALVARRDDLQLTTIQGDMADLSQFDDGQFDLIFHPVSNVFVPDILSVWQECYRVLATGGRLLSGFMNPDFFLFDHEALDAGQPLLVTNKLPYADTEDMAPQALDKLQKEMQAFEFSHSLDTQIGGQIAAGFRLAGFYEDRWSDEATRLNPYMPTLMATLAIKATQPT